MRQGTERERRAFGVVGGLLVGGVGAWLLYRQHGAVGAPLAAVGTALLAAGVIRPRALRVPYGAWMGFAFVLGFVNSRILLAVFYILLVCPIALIGKAFGRDPLRMRWSRDGESDWRDRSEERSAASSYENQF